jgi:hypothetical protein
VLLPTFSQSSTERFNNKVAGSIHGGSPNRFCIIANGVMRTHLRRLTRAKQFRKPRPRQASGQIASQPPRFYSAKTALSGFLCGSAFSVLD